MSAEDGSRGPASGLERVGLFGNAEKDELPEAIETIVQRCAKGGVEVITSQDLARISPAGLRSLRDPDLIQNTQLIIALGGDGTMLRAARLLGTSGVPLLGVNLGSLGYLTDVPLDRLGEALDRVLAGDYHLETRSRVYCSLMRHGEGIATHRALNDMVVNMGPLPRALDMELFLDGFPVGKFLGDGIIVSTPTGSTAYSLSAGGPICHWAVPGLLITPICPHSLGLRPVIVSEETRIELLLHQTGEGAVLAADGQKSEILQNGDRLAFRQSNREVNLVKFPDSNFYAVMRHKLHWGGSHRSVRRDARC